MSKVFTIKYPTVKDVIDYRVKNTCGIMCAKQATMKHALSCAIGNAETIQDIKIILLAMLKEEY